MTTMKPSNSQCSSILKTGVSRKRDCPSSVSFNSEARLHYIETIREFTADEVIAAYYQCNEYKAIKAGNKLLTKKLKNGDACGENDDVCYRGLEHKTEEVTRRRRRSRLEASMAVYDEQCRQQEEGTTDEELIRDAYENETYMSQEIAHEIAVRDAREAERCWLASNDAACDAVVEPTLAKDFNLVPKHELSAIATKPRSLVPSPVHLKGISIFFVSRREHRAR